MYSPLIRPRTALSPPFHRPFTGLLYISSTYHKLDVRSTTNTPQSDDRPDIEELADRMLNTADPTNLPRMKSSNLIRHTGGSVRLTVMQDAWVDAGREYEDPGSVLQMYFPSSDLLLIDLS